MKSNQMGFLFSGSNQMQNKDNDKKEMNIGCPILKRR
jgi:hypothetical protein